MRIFGFLIIASFLFLFILFRSGTFETQVTNERRGGVEYVVTKHSIHWDRFSQYIKDIPLKVVNNLRSAKALLKR